VNEGLDQGPYVAAGVGFKTRDPPSQDAELTTEPACPTMYELPGQ